MGPLAHVASGKVLGAPALSSLWMDTPVLAGMVKVLDRREAQRMADLTHGWPGLLVAGLVWGRPGMIGWALHVALDSFSHAPGQGSHINGPKVWLP